MEMQKITNCLWFQGEAEEAARYYVSLFPDSRIDKVHFALSDTPGVEKGGVLFVEFTLAGQRFQSLSGNSSDPFNNSISLSVSCADQAEVDRYWESLTADGGEPIACGWLKDRYGVSWQIVPSRLMELISDADPARASRAMKAMMEMVKIDIAALEAAADGGD